MPGIKSHLKDVCRIQSEERSRRCFLRLDMNENVSGLPEAFVKKILSEIDPDFLATYPEYKILQEKIARYNNLHQENICLSNGSDAAIKYIFDAYVSPGDKVLLTDPTFAMYPVYCKIFNAEPMVIEYNPDLSFPLKKIIDNISSEINIVVVVNPNNPAGSVVQHGDLLRIIKKAANNDVLIIVDEAYFYFYPHTIIEQVKNFKNLIILRTFSKLCGMASLRLGYAAGHSEVMENLRRVKPTYDINGLAILFAEKLLDRPDIIEDLIKSTNEGEKYLINKLYEAGIEYKKSLANFVLIKCGNRVKEIVKKLAEEGILVNGGFKQDFLKEYIRVTIGNKNTMEQFWETFITIYRSMVG